MLMGIAMPPRDPDEDEEDEDEDDDDAEERQSCASRTKTRLAGAWQSALQYLPWAGTRKT